jgi:lipopolysaccharide export system permease protein
VFKILDRYIASTSLLLITAALLLVLGVDFLFAYIHELGGVGRGDYHATTALFYTALTLPRRLYDLFPIASLIGVLMALGLLASRSELIVMRASGMSMVQIASAVAKVGVLMAVSASLLGEFVVPKAEYMAEGLKIQAKSSGQAVLTAQGTWVREEDDFIHIRSLLPNGVLQEVTRYRFNDRYELQSTTFIQEAKYRHHQWELTGIKESLISPKKVTMKEKASDTTKDLIDPALLEVLLSEPDNLSLIGLYHYIKYLKENKLDASHYELILWQKIAAPFSVILMILLGVPFVFGPLRNASMGLRMLSGIFFGFLFYLVNEIFGPLSLVYHLPPILAAWAPLLLFAFFGFWMMRRVL